MEFFKCPFEQTVNLTNHHSYVNGSYLYQGILIPPEKTHPYKYDIKFMGFTKSVPSHMRGCACDKQPCIKLCCDKDKFFNETKTKNRCEKITNDMSVSGNLPIRLEGGLEEIRDVFKHFIYQVGFPCEHPKSMLSMNDRAVLFENGSLYSQANKSLLNTLNYCYSPRLNNKSEYILQPFSCPMNTEVPWQIRLNTYAMALSVLFLIPTIVVYSILKELRENLNGKLVICYLCCLTMGYAIIVFINMSQITFDMLPCHLLGFTSYFFFMAAYFWLSVFCFDIWIKFQASNVQISPRRNFKYFIIYSLYAWFSAGLTTCLLIYIEISPDIDELYKPDIGIYCWLNTEKWSALIYFYGPLLLILLFNCAIFIHLTAKVYTVKRDLARLTPTKKFLKKNVIVILRLFLIMGISWIFDVLSYCVREFTNWDFFFYFSDFANAIQGIAIFSMFVLKSNVLNLLKKRLCNKNIVNENTSISSSAVIIRLSKLKISTSVPGEVTS